MQQTQLQMLAQSGLRLSPQALAKADAQALEAGLQASVEPPPVTQSGAASLSSRQAFLLGALEAGVNVRAEALEAADAEALAAAIELSKAESQAAPGMPDTPEMSDMPQGAGAQRRPLPTPPGAKSNTPEPQPHDHLAHAAEIQKMQAQNTLITLAQHKSKLSNAAGEAMRTLTQA